MHSTESSLVRLLQSSLRPSADRPPLPVVAKATAIPIVDGTGSWVWVIWISAFISTFVLVVNIGYVIFETRLPHEFRPRTGCQTAKTHPGGGFRLQLAKSWAAVMGLPAIFWLITLSQVCWPSLQASEFDDLC